MNISNSFNETKRKKWTNSQTEKLIFLAELHNNNWQMVSSEIKIRTAKQCQKKYQILISNFKRGKWSTNEDELIKKWVAQNGAENWGKCAETLIERTGKQCRERWTNVLDPSIIKKGWTSLEQFRIIQAMKVHANRWKDISGLIRGRTSNSIKNYVNSSLRSLKNSQIIKFIRPLLIRPMYINKGKFKVYNNKSAFNKESKAL
jgi:hypothetical protein